MITGEYPPARVLLDGTWTTTAHGSTPPHMLITFSGLDGAGKSTLIEWLRVALEAQRHRVTVLHLEHNVGVYATVRRVRDGVARLARREPGTAVPTAPSRGRIATLLRRIRDAVVWSKVVRRVIYPLDVAVFLCYRAYIEGIRGQVLIMDRYFYDILVDVSSPRARGWIRWLKRITPTPTLPVLLDTGPEDAYARKGEYSVAYLRDRWTAYGEVFPWVRGGVRLRNDDPAAARAALAQVVSWRMSGAESPSPAALGQP